LWKGTLQDADWQDELAERLVRRLWRVGHNAKSPSHKPDYFVVFTAILRSSVHDSCRTGRYRLARDGAVLAPLKEAG
jgi:hypothetical protein